jgi:hypothetical protein
VNGAVEGIMVTKPGMKAYRAVVANNQSGDYNRPSPLLAGSCDCLDEIFTTETFLAKAVDLPTP